MEIRKNDTVRVIAGKDRGKQGKVIQSLPREQRVVVEGVNLIKRHAKARPGIRQAGIVQREAPIHVSNVMLVCSKCGKTTRIRHTILDDGRKVRACLKCGETID